MAVSYSSYDPSACLAHNGITQTSSRGPNQCDPSSLNPDNISSLGEFKMSMLRDILSNNRLGQNLGLCHDLARILPTTFPEIHNVTLDPNTLNVGALHLQDLMQRTVPSPYNNSSPADVTAWWYNNANNDTEGTVNFLNVSVHSSCLKEICYARNSIGDADITGIGMLISTGMLILLTCFFVWPAYSIFMASQDEDKGTRITFEDESKSIRAAYQNKDKGYRRSLIKRLPDFFEAITVFTLSILVSAIIYRVNYTAYMSVYNLFMAEMLSLVGSTVMVMVAASCWQHSNKPSLNGTTTKPGLKGIHIAGFFLNTLLTIVLFSLEFHFQHWDPNDEGLPSEKRCLQTVWGDETDLNNLGGKRSTLPVCFSLWLVALLGSLIYLLALMYPAKLAERKKDSRMFKAMFKALGIVPMLLGTAVLIWLCYMFFETWKDMKKAFGQAFVGTEKDWTFGQFLALFTWCPPLLAVLGGCLKVFIGRHFDTSET